MMNSFPFINDHFIVVLYAFFNYLTVFGAIACLIWLYKFGKKETLKKVSIITLTVGIAGMIGLFAFSLLRFFHSISTL